MKKVYEMRLYTNNKDFAKGRVIEEHKCRGGTFCRLQKKKDAEQYRVVIPVLAYCRLDFKFWEILTRGLFKIEEKFYTSAKARAQQEA